MFFNVSSHWPSTRTKRNVGVLQISPSNFQLRASFRAPLDEEKLKRKDLKINSIWYVNDVFMRNYAKTELATSHPVGKAREQSEEFLK